MKKTYIVPVCESIALAPASELLNVLSKVGGDEDNGTVTDKTQILSNRRGWNSADWSAADEEEE